VSDETELERDFLRSARRGLSPSRADETRVHAAVTKLAALAPAAPAPGDASGGVAAASNATKRWFSRLAVGAGLVAGGGAAYVAGHRAGVEEGRTVGRAEAPSAVESPRSAPTAERARPEPPAAVLAPPPEVAAPRAASPKPSAELANAPDSGLDEEVRFLKRIERALRDQNPRYALGLLGELERTVPGGQLVEERHAAKAMARCQVLGGSQAMIDDFSKAHPGSAYVTRVTETCRGAEQRNPAPPDTHR
jgi:hypothetical protein